jgi:hypothetical protein
MFFIAVSFAAFLSSALDWAKVVVKGRRRRRVNRLFIGGIIIL